MSCRDGEDRRSIHADRIAADSIIAEALDEDPSHVAHLLVEVVKRCKAEARYTAEEIEAAAAQLRRELGLTHGLIERY